MIDRRCQCWANEWLKMSSSSWHRHGGRKAIFPKWTSLSQHHAGVPLTRLQAQGFPSSVFEVLTTPFPHEPPDFSPSAPLSQSQRSSTETHYSVRTYCELKASQPVQLWGGEEQRERFSKTHQELELEWMGLMAHAGTVSFNKESHDTLSNGKNFSTHFALL